MTDSTLAFWDVDGVSLQTYASNIRTLAGRSGVPTFRGENEPLAYHPGVFHKKKTIDARQMSLLMWVQGTDADGLPTARGSKLQFEKNWRALRQLLWRDDSELFTITKRWIDPDTFEVVKASALVENIGSMDPVPQGTAHATFSVDLLMVEGLFFGEAETVEVAAGETITLTNVGDARTHKISIEFEGQLLNPVLTNSTFSPDNWVKVGSSIAVDDKVTLDVEGMTATRWGDGANLIGAVSRSGMRQWFGLAAGDNTISLETDEGAGLARITWRPAYF